MSNDRPTDIEDIDAAFARLNEIGTRLQEGIRAAGVLHVNTVAGGDWEQASKSPTWDYRDSAMYRLKSIRHHLRFLVSLRVSVNRRINEKNPLDQFAERDKTRELREHWAGERSALFDSFVFQISSLFDYLAYLSYSIYGNNRHIASLTWPGVAKAARDQKGNKISQTSVGREIVRLDKEWVARLYDYRSELIHRRMDKGGWALHYGSLQDDESLSEFFVYAPGRLLTKSKELRDERYTILYMAFWLAERTFEAADKLVMSLNQDLYEETKKVPVVEPGKTYFRVLHPDLTTPPNDHGT